MWILPNSKPFERIECWVTIDTILGRQVCAAYFEDNKWFNLNDVEINIIAWQYVNFPEPYENI